MSSYSNVYLLQYGVYVDINVLNDNIKELEDYVLLENNDKYYVYVGAFTTYENAYRLSEIFEEEGIYTYIKNEYITDDEFIQELSQLDNQIYTKDSQEEIKTVSKKMLDLYRNILK